jgi:hypothetical protein
MPMTSTLRHGIAAGVLLSLLAFGPYAVPALRSGWLQVSDAWTLAAALPCLAATWLAMRVERRRRGGGGLRFGPALATGVQVALVAAAVAGLAAWLFHLVAGPPLAEALYAAHVAQVGADHASDPAAKQTLADLQAVRPMFFDHRLQAMLVAGTVLAIGVLESLAAALLMRGDGAR